MTLNIDITPDDEKMLNDILDEGINDMKVSNSMKNEEIFTNRLKLDNKESSDSNNISSINTNNLMKNVNNTKPKSSALRALLDEIKSDHSSPSSSKSPPKMTFEASKVSLLQKSQNSIDKASKTTNSYEKEIKRNMSTISNKSKDLNFHDMKSEINSIQEKIEGLEKKLFSSSKVWTNDEDKNIPIKLEESNNISSSSYENFKRTSSNLIKKNSNVLQKTKEILKQKDHKNSFSFNNYHPLTHASFKEKNDKKINSSKDFESKRSSKLEEKKRNRTIDDNRYKSNYRSISTESSKNGSINKSLMNKSNNLNNNSYYKSALNEWKERFYKSQKENEQLRNSLVTEKKKVLECEKKTKLNEKKINNFDELNLRMNKLISDHENLINQYEQSELIRREQAKLIKSLQYEVDILRKYSKIADDEPIKLNQKNETIEREAQKENENIVKKKGKKKKKKSVEPKITSKGEENARNRLNINK